MFGKKKLEQFKNEVDSLLVNTSLSKEDTANKLFVIYNSACTAYGCKKWCTTELYDIIKCFLKENNISFGELIAGFMEHPPAVNIGECNI